MSKRKTLLAILALTLAPILWGGNFVAGRALGGSLDGVTLNLWRWLIALLVLAPLLLPSTLRHRREIQREAPHLVVLGLLGVTGFNTVLYAGLRYSDVSLAAIVFAITPLMIAALSAALNREAPSDRLMAGMLISFFAMFVAQAGAFRDGMDPKGIALIFAAAMIWSVYCVLLRRRRSCVPAGPAFFVQIVVGVILLLPAAILFGDPLPPLRASEAAALAYLGLGAAALAFWLWQQGISALGPARAGPFMNIVPISSLALGWLLLGTPVNGLEIAAFAVVLLGVALSNAPRAWIAPVLSPRVALCLAIVLMPSQAVA